MNKVTGFHKRSRQNWLSWWLSVWYCTLFILVGAGSVAQASPIISQLNLPVLSTQQGLSQDTINDVIIDNAGFVWIATDGGLNRWDGQHILSIDGPDNIFVNASIKKLFLDSRDRLWISTANSGVYTLNLATGTVTQQVLRPALNSTGWAQSAQDFRETADGDIVLALDHEVLKVSADLVHHEVRFTLPQVMRERHEGIRAVHLGETYTYIASTHGVFAKHRTRPTAEPLVLDYLGQVPANMANQNAKFLHTDSDGRLFIGTVEGLYMAPQAQVEHALQTRQPVNFDVVMAQQNVWKIIERDAGGFWAATNNGLFSLTQDLQGNWLTLHLLRAQHGQQDLAKSKIRTMTVNALGNLWLGTELGGLMYWRPENQQITHIQNTVSEPPVLTNNIIWALHQDAAGILWAGTANGLTRLDLETLQSQFYLRKQGEYFDDDAVHTIHPAGEDKLILGTQSGLKLFDKSSGTTASLPTQNPADQKILDGYLYGSAVDAKGRLYFLTHDFYRYLPAEQRLEKLEFSGDVPDVTQVSQFLGTSERLDGQMLLSSSEAVWLVDPETLQARQVYQYLPVEKHSDATVTSWEVDENHVLWLGFPRFGIVGVQMETGQVVERFNTSNLLSTNVVYNVTADSSNHLWYSSHQGVYRFSPRQHLLQDFAFGRELNVSEFNSGAGTKLADGRIAFGSTRGIAIFTPQPASEVSMSRPTVPLVISNLSVGSRSLSLPLQDLAGTHLALDHDDYGLTISFTHALRSFNHTDSYAYTLLRDDQVVSRSLTSDGRAAFAFLAPGEYRFEVAPVVERFDYKITPAHITFTIAHAPLRSPAALALYAAIVVLLMALFGWYRRYQNRVKAQTQRQLQIMGEAFSQTRDWVIVFDPNLTPVAANTAFCRAFALADNERQQTQALIDLFRNKRRLAHQLQQPLLALAPGGYSQRETRLTAADGLHHDVIIDATAVADEGGQPHTDHYLVVISDISQQKAAERQLVRLARYDSLTGLANRSLLLEDLQQALEGAAEHQRRVAVLFVDLDRFKGINDSLGHDQGDQLLKIVAERMVAAASPEDTVARLGGDEFVIVRPQMESEQLINSFVGQLIAAIETPIALGDEVLCISCSVGISFYPEDAQTPAELLKQADVAMYTAKKNTVDGFVYFTRDMNDRAKDLMLLENKVKLAYQEGRFYNVYQPIVDTAAGKIEGVELLLRCHSADAPMSPGEFVPVLEQLRYIVDVTRKAIVRALDDVAAWRQLGFEGYVSINISALHFKAELYLDLLRRMMYARGLNESAMRFEITEGLLMDDTAFAMAQIAQFQKAGFTFSLDDFGTGYSSLSYLKNFSLDVLKIDRSFVEDIESDEMAAALVKTSIQLAATFGMDCVAEGVETASQAALLNRLGCRHHQGFYYARPLPTDQISDLLRQPALLQTGSGNG